MSELTELPSAIPDAVTAAAAKRDLGSLVAVAHEPSNTTGSRTRKLYLGDSFGGLVSIVIGAALVVLAFVASGPIGSRLVAIVAGVLAVLFGRYLNQEGKRERSWDIYHFADGFVRWNAKTNQADGHRWSDFTGAHDRIVTSKRFGVTVSVDYRATLNRSGAKPIILSTSSSSRDRLNWESAKLRTLVEHAKRSVRTRR